MRKFWIILASIALLLAWTAEAQGQSAGKSPPRSCFHTSSWKGWKATPDARAMYIRIERDRVYRLDLDAACRALNAPGATLITKLTGPWICDPLDLQMKVSEGRGFVTPCTVRRNTPLSAGEAQALPKSLQP